METNTADCDGRLHLKARQAHLVYLVYLDIFGTQDVGLRQLTMALHDIGQVHGDGFP